MSSTSNKLNITRRPRRNRINNAMRNAVQETTLSAQHLVLPIFIQDGVNKDDPIKSMPGNSRMSIDVTVKKAKEAVECGICALALFPAIPDSLKSKLAEESYNDDGLLQRCVREIKKEISSDKLLIITDVAMDPYSSDGHDGYVTEKGEIDNDITVPILCKMAVSQAKAGADVVAPSDMMDGRIGAIRQALDDAGYTHVAICSYSVKYASSFYGPFRDALDSAPKAGDKKTYQMNPANAREALIEVKLDVEEGADWVMVKPGLPYLDVVHRVRENCNVPVAVYHVSGEFSMLKAAAANGWLNYEACLIEALLSMRRAGADIIFTYGALDAARILQQSKK